MGFRLRWANLKKWQKGCGCLIFIFIGLSIIGNIASSLEVRRIANMSEAERVEMYAQRTATAVNAEETRQSNAKATSEARNAEATTTAEARMAEAEERATANAEYYARCDRISGVEYDDLYRHIEDHVDQPYFFVGKIVQVVIGRNDIHDYRMNITRDEFGFWEDDIYIQVDEDTLLEDRILEDDILGFCGSPLGLIQYETVMGGKREVPSVYMIRFTTFMECNDGGCQRKE